MVIRTVDEAQGSEADVSMLSCVRSNQPAARLSFCRTPLSLQQALQWGWRGGASKMTELSPTARSNGACEVGFLRNPNRLCVALSRSKRELHIFGDGQTCSGASPGTQTQDTTRGVLYELAPRMSLSLSSG